MVQALIYNGYEVDDRTGASASVDVMRSALLNREVDLIWDMMAMLFLILILSGILSSSIWKAGRPFMTGIWKIISWYGCLRLRLITMA